MNHYVKERPAKNGQQREICVSAIPTRTKAGGSHSNMGQPKSDMVFSAVCVDSVVKGAYHEGCEY